jgi:hypothetical protein
MKKFILASFIAAFTVTAFAADATGKYNGKVSMDLSSVKNMVRKEAAKLTGDKKKKVEGQIAMIEMQEKGFAKAVISLELKKDRSLSISQSMSGKSKSEAGKWSQSGNKVKMFGFSGKDGGPKEMNGVMSADGKSIIFDLSDEMKKQASKNGAPAGFAGKMVISFKRA